MTGSDRHQSDETMALLKEGYDFLPRRFARAGGDVYRTRLMMRSVTCVRGEAAARMFYAPDRFTRKGAMPPNTLLSLQDLGSVQTLDGPAHRHRKRLFLSLMTSESVRALGQAFEAAWRERMAAWGDAPVRLFVEASAILTRAVCAWGGSPLSEAEADRRTREFRSMIEGAGGVGPRNWLGLALRARTEHWARRLVREARSGARPAPEGSALAAVVHHLDESGQSLGVSTAAVEYLNFLRPTVAVDRFIAFAALALHEHPSWRERLRGADWALYEAFAQEVRRTTPFFPAIGGKAMRELVWEGGRIAEGEWVLLDLHSLNRDPRSWTTPERFDPDRFLRGEAGLYNFAPQGAGDATTTHRCPGEWIAIDLVARAVRLLVEEVNWELPAQDLSVDLGRMPALPRSGVRIRRL